jgi:hypothetical protein
MGPSSRPPAKLLGYHLTVDSHGNLIKIQPDLDYPRNLGEPWGGTYGFKTVADFAARADFDALVIHTPKE